MKEWITGRNPVYETLRARRRHFFRLCIAQGVEEKGRILDIRELGKRVGLKPEMVSRQQLDSHGGNHQGVALEASAYPTCALDDILDTAQHRNEDPFILLLDVIQDPQNLGTLLRTAEAVGIHGVIMPQRRAASVTPAVVNASAGASEHLMITTGNLAQAIEKLKEAEIWVAGLEGSPEAKPIEQARLDGALALVVGSEGSGMRSLVRKSCDFLIRLPMFGKITSFNAAVAGSIVLFMAKQSRERERLQ